MARIDAFLKLGTDQGCSDIHFAVGVPPMLRMHGDLIPVKFRELSHAELDGYIAEVTTKTHQAHLRRGEDLDFSYVASNGAASVPISSARTPEWAQLSAPFLPLYLRWNHYSFLRSSRSSAITIKE